MGKLKRREGWGIVLWLIGGGFAAIAVRAAQGESYVLAFICGIAALFIFLQGGLYLGFGKKVPKS